MFVLHASNKTENLLAHLDTILETPLSHPFVKEEFLIQSQGMQRWLSQQLAEKKGIWANFEFHFPGKFLARIVDKLTIDEEVELFNQEFLVWHLDNALRGLNDEPFDILQHYIEGESEDLKRYQLSEKLAFLFDQYQFMRPDWLLAWEKDQSVLQNPAEEWQRKLWQQLTSNINADSKSSNKPKCNSKGSLWLSVIKQLQKMDSCEAKKVLPERLCIFGINGMSPIYLSFLQTIANFIDVHFFLLNPAKAYWADLPNKRQLARQMAANEQTQSLDNVTEEKDILFNIGHPLLSALGQQGRDFQQLLLEQCDFQLEYVSFEKHKGNAVLARLQNDILNNSLDGNSNNRTSNNKKNKNKKNLKPDHSISIHACHSRMRETEVLKDQLLKRLDEDHSLTLRDIVVMTPDITHYAPYISAVFEDIPHAIADRNMLDSNDPLSVFLRFLSMSQNRWELESVFDVLEQEVVHQKFALMPADLENIRTWVAETYIRWGESAEHRAELGFPAFTENSWRAGIERLLMGYANSDDSRFSGLDDKNAVLPFAEIEGSQAQALGGLHDFFSLLSQAKKTFSKPHTLYFWIEHLSYFAERLLVSTDAFQHAYAALIKLITELSTFQDIHQNKVSLDVILAWFNTTATNQQSGAGFLRGQLTFCSMLPMRAIPFKIIALMGMNEGEYPRVETRAAFDLMASNFRKGDKSPRVDERYQFLEVLLSAQQQLIITYIGQSKNGNSPIPPSVVVSELLEVLDEYYLSKDEIKLPFFHSLHAHSRQYFTDSDIFFSYSAQQLATANALARRQHEERHDWWQGKITQDAKTIIELHDLFSFFQHPQRHFVQQQLQISIPAIEGRAAETEPFLLDALSTYTITQEWVERHLAGNLDDEAFYLRLMAQGRWLSGSNGKVSFEAHREIVIDFAKKVASKAMGKRLTPISIDLVLGEYRIVGSLEQQYEQGSLFYRYANLKGKDLLPAWITHLLTQLMEPTENTVTWLLTKDQEWLLGDIQDSEALLVELIDHYIGGQQRPSSLLLEPAIAWQNQTQKKSAKVTPLHSAAKTYHKNLPYDPYMQLLYKNLSVEEIMDGDFEESCGLLTSIWLAKTQ